MLVQMPRGSSSDQPGSQNAEECSAFEAALRRDLAAAPVISYESILGGWTKRAFEFSLTLLTAPIWAPVLLIAALWAKSQHPALVFRAHERIGYGGRSFWCFSLRLTPPSATIERLHTDEPAPANDWTEIERQAEDRRVKWRRALERLPQLLNVLRGEMALVGPRPLSRSDLEPLKIAKRYYLSARPGVIGVSSIVDPSDDPSSQYKGYALSWTLSTDLLIMWDALRSLRDRGELWRPTRLKRDATAPAVRRRTAASS